jgi:hypothetical protein
MKNLNFEDEEPRKGSRNDKKETKKPKLTDKRKKPKGPKK